MTCIKSDFETPNRAASEADLVLSTQLRTDDDASEPTNIENAILFEHQSTFDDRMPLRLLGYMLRTLEARLAERGRKRRCRNDVIDMTDDAVAGAGTTPIGWSSEERHSVRIGDLHSA